MEKFNPEEHGKMVADNFNEQKLIFRLRERARIRRQILTRKSVQEGAPDRISDLLEEAADALMESVYILERLDLWLEERHLGGLMPHEREFINKMKPK